MQFFKKATYVAVDFWFEKKYSILVWSNVFWWKSFNLVFSIPYEYLE